MGFHMKPSLPRVFGGRGAVVQFAAAALAVGIAGVVPAQNILINEVNRNAGALTATGDEWIEIVIVEPLTAAELNTYVVGDSSGTRESKFGGFQFTGMEGIAANFPAGTIIVIGGGTSGVVEDLSYNPGGGDWNLTLIPGTSFLTNVGSGNIDFAGTDIAYVDTSAEGLLSSDGFAVNWPGPDAGGAFGQSATVLVSPAPANNGATTLGTFGNDFYMLDSVFWDNAMAPSPGLPNDMDVNGTWITNLRLGIPSSDPLIRVAQRLVDFGAVADDVFPLPTQQFTITNSALASNNLTIASLTVQPNDNNFRVVSPTPATPFNIAPGGSATVTVEFDPLGAPGSFSATLVIDHNDSNADKPDIEVTLTGSALNSADPAAFTGSLPAVYAQDFNSLPNVELFDEGGLFSPYEWENNVTLPSWYADRSVDGPVTGILASAGEENNGFGALTGALYSFGQEADVDRAIGSSASNSTGSFTYAARLRNDTTETITGIEVDYTGEQWRKVNVTVPQSLVFSYLISDTPVLQLPSTGFTDVPALNFAAPQFDGTTSPLDGNDAANREQIVATISGLSIEPGQEVILRWTDLNDAGNDHALAIDDVVVTAYPATAPTILTDTAGLTTIVAEAGVPSASQSYTVSAENLTDLLTIAPPAGFQVSLSAAGPWTSAPSTLTIAPSEGTIGATSVFVRAVSGTIGPLSGKIIHTTPDAGVEVVLVSGVIQPGPRFLTALDVANEEDFDGMGSAPAAALPEGFALVGASLDSSQFTFVTGASAGNVGAGSVTGSSGGNAYNFGDGINAQATDRAVGFLTTGSFTSPRNVILSLINDTDSLITDLDVTFDVEKYRSGNREFNFNFFINANGGGWTKVDSASVNFPSDGANTIIYSPALSFPQIAAIGGLSVAPGQRILLRWEYSGVGGSTNGQGLAVDNVSVTPSGVPYEGGELGDLNGDGVINVADVTELANLVVNGPLPALSIGDINDDGAVDFADVDALAEMIVND